MTITERCQTKKTPCETGKKYAIVYYSHKSIVLLILWLLGTVGDHIEGSDATPTVGESV